MHQNNRAAQLGSMVVDTLRSLAAATTPANFEQAYQDFAQIWSQDCPAYLEYFNSIWMRRFPPILWARYARHLDDPSGDQVLEVSIFVLCLSLICTIYFRVIIIE